MKPVLTKVSAAVVLCFFGAVANAEEYRTATCGGPGQGGTGGKIWEAPVWSTVKTIQVRGGKFLDSLTFTSRKDSDSPIVTKKVGGNGGKGFFQQIDIDGDEITSFALRCGNQFVNSISLSNSKMKLAMPESAKPISDAVGSPPPGTKIKIIGMRGQAGAYIDNIAIKYLVGYQPSKKYASQVIIVSDTIAGGSEAETSNESSYSSSLSDLRTTQFIESIKLSAEASVAYDYFSSTISASYEQSRESYTSIKSDTTKTMASASKIKTTIPSDSVGVQMFAGDIMEFGGKYWVKPNTETTLYVFKVSELQDSLKGVFFMNPGVKTYSKALQANLKKLGDNLYYTDDINGAAPNQNVGTSMARVKAASVVK